MNVSFFHSLQLHIMIIYMAAAGSCRNVVTNNSNCYSKSITHNVEEHLNSTASGSKIASHNTEEWVD